MRRWCVTMQSGWDGVSAVSAVFVAAYAAIATDYVAHYDLGFSLAEIRIAAVLTAIVIAALTCIDFFGKRLRKSR